ncbi:LuxR C-terminal-related transcriptional regulator [Streptomyces sp. NPDC048595]|uniref:LuxR C-terminal-related transcriptional regulator n=1 Tax=Streptomyces sp. NPDC048595 TaxID=3365576 RepID=UPI00371B0F3C
MPRSTDSAAAADDGESATRALRTPATASDDGGTPAHLAPTGDPLLAAKYSVPSVPRKAIRRQRLLDRLTEGTAGPLTLITGPAGAGKTTLAASWARGGSAPGPVVWLTAEPDDRAPGVFWAYVLEALNHHQVALPDEVGQPGAADHVDHSLLTRLASALAQLRRPVVLVIDGLEHVPVRAVTADLDFVLTHAGPQLRLVLVSRVDPLLPLHRYRADGRILEIRGPDLAFTRQEAARLLRGHGLAGYEESVDALLARTEGWAAGLRLCALEMQRADDPAEFARSFAASQSALADYLLTEVFAAQPAATQELLMRGSILDRVHPDLANVLTGREDAEWALAELTRAHLFVEPIDGTPWCRYQPLFAEVLRMHLRHHRPGLEPRLRRRAATWLADTGRLAEGMEQAAAAADWEWACTRMVGRLEIGRLLTGPEAPRLERAFSGMPGDLPGVAPALVAAACALARYDTANCRARLDRAENELRGPGAGPAPEARLALALLRLLAGPPPAQDGDQVCRAARSAAQQTRELADRLPRPLTEAHQEIEALRRYGLACGLQLGGRPDEAMRAFDHAVEGCTAEVTGTVREGSLGRLALMESERGELSRAEKHALLALELAQDRSAPPTRRSGISHLALAAVALERGELRAARRRVDLAAASPDAGHDPVTDCEIAVARSRLDLAHGRWQAALAALKGDADALAPGPAQRLAVARSAAQLARGDPASAIAALAGSADGGTAHTLALARARLAAGDLDQAVGLLAPLDHRPDAGTTEQIRIRLLQSHAAALAQDPETACRRLHDALAAARPERIRRPFTEAGPWVWHLLEQRPDLATGHAWLLDRPARVNSRPRTDGGARPPAPVMVEALTEREREVLQHGAELLSTEEIAEAMYLSVNTVKTHLRSIYRKLTVSRRGDAVRRARELHLL